MTEDGATPLDVLFVGNQASRTGAPLMLLYFLRWLRAHTDLEFEVVLLAGGPLLADFRELAPTVVVADDGIEAIGERARACPIVYCNCVQTLLVVPELGEAPHGRTVITHVHELEGGIQMSLPDGRDRLLGALTDHWVAASDRVADNLVERHGVDRGAIARHYEFIDVDALDAQPVSADDLAGMRAALGIPDDALVVGAMGVAEWRKGPDLFVVLGTVLAGRPGPPVHLVWVGADESRSETAFIRRDAERAGLADRVHVVGVDATPARWLSLFDVFVLTSREDPFPLVCLEASLLGVPVVSFDNTGMGEFLGDGEHGYVVPLLDVEAMADRVGELLDDPARRRALGRSASAAVRARFDVAVGAPALHQELRGWMADA